MRASRLRSTVPIIPAEPAADGSECVVSSTYLGAVGPAIDQPVREELPDEAGTRAWFHDAEGVTWETEATTSDLFRIACSDPRHARRLAQSARFVTPS